MKFTLEFMGACFLKCIIAANWILGQWKGLTYKMGEAVPIVLELVMVQK